MAIDPPVDASASFDIAIDELSAHELDDLPYGVIKVDEHGVILFYSKRESEISGRSVASVVGRNFFHDVAPCTAAPEFYGSFLEGVRRGKLESEFLFVFDFDMEPVEVQIRMTSAAEDGQYWLLIRPVRRFQRTEGSRQRRARSRAGKVATTRLRGGHRHSAECELEPIERPEAIQPWGMLMVVDPATGQVVQCSDNALGFVERDAPDVVGEHVQVTLGATPEVGELLAWARAAERGDVSQLRYRRPRGAVGLVLRATRWAEWLLIELERSSDDRRALSLSASTVSSSLGPRVYAGEDETAVLDALCEVARELTGHLNSFVLRINADDDLEVVAERRIDGGRSFLGNRYPASDIPQRARELYRRSPLRYVASREYPEISLCSASDVSAVDIGAAQCRSISPRHREYNRQLGVDGSVSASMVLNGRLWGLLCCQSPRPLPLHSETRAELVRITELAVARLGELIWRVRARETEEAVNSLNELIGPLDLGASWREQLLGQREGLCRLVGASGMAIVQYRESMTDRDSEATQRNIDRFGDAIDEHIDGADLWSTRALAELVPEAREMLPRVAGMMVIQLTDDQRLVFWRRSRAQQVRWGRRFGEPTGTDGGDSRKFEAWIQDVEHRSEPWTEREHAVARALRSVVTGVMLRHATQYEVVAKRLGDRTRELEKARRRLEIAAETDALTGLLNRAAFVRAFRREYESVVPERESVLVVVDADNLKVINDGFGHQFGDELLCEIARRLREGFGDVPLARLGGDEFALHLPVALPEAESLARNTSKLLAAPLEVGPVRIRTSCSIGIAAVRLGDRFGDVFKRADAALYRAKEYGSGQVRVFDARLAQSMSRQSHVERRLLEARLEEQITVYLQEQTGLTSVLPKRRFEVLARWSPGSDDSIGPEEFIAAAQRVGVMRELTDRVLDLAMKTAREFIARCGPARFGVNVSSADLQDSAFVDGVLERLAHYELDGGCLELELTESLLLNVSPEVVDGLQRLRKSGVKIALDDFGTGYSSLSHLRDLPLDTVKLDRSFVARLGQPDGVQLVRGVVNLAHGLDKAVIAEGVEHAEQAEKLVEAGCEWGQGFFWHRPEPISAVFARYCGDNGFVDG